VTAVEAIDRARAAGLTLQRASGGLKVKGPKAARTALRGVLEPLVSEILRLLPEHNSDAEEPGTGGSRVSAVVVATPCDECGRDARLSLISDDGTRACVDCLTGRTAMRIRGVPI
jgi:hypothetical protein